MKTTGFLALALLGGPAPQEGTIRLNARRLDQVEPVTWEGKKTAVLICDMWDRHWCAGATRRVAEMAPRMNDTVAELRRRGALIIHCPSDTMDFYKDTPQRRLAREAPPVKTRIPLARWQKLVPEREGRLPIDDSDGGCDDDPPCKPGKAWSRQIEVLRIEEGDAVTDSAEAFCLMKQRGIENAILMGVHTNMCVLGRPFGIRQLVLQGMNVVLMRDLTDTMYNSRRPPTASHFRGTDLVVRHIERYWCPTATSADVLGGEPFRFAGDPGPVEIRRLRDGAGRVFSCRCRADLASGEEFVEVAKSLDRSEEGLWDNLRTEVSRDGRRYRVGIVDNGWKEGVDRGPEWARVTVEEVDEATGRPLRRFSFREFLGDHQRSGIRCLRIEENQVRFVVQFWNDD